MDIGAYNLQDLVLTALKSEIASRDAYSKLAERVKNAFLKEKLRYLSQEEEKHRGIVVEIFHDTFPGTAIVLPENSIVPLPEIRIEDELEPLSAILESAMEAEMAAYKFYNALSERFEDSKIQLTLAYFATMEMGHYRILEIERENTQRFEDFDPVWSMMHAGP